MLKEEQGWKRLLSVRNGLIMGAIILFVLTVSYITVMAMSKVITLVDNDSAQEVSTMKSTVGEFFEEKGITTIPEDYVSLSSETKLEDGMQIVIKRAVVVRIHDEGNIIGIKTVKDTVAEVLEQTEVILLEKDILINTELDAELTDNMDIYVKRAVPVKINADGNIFDIKTVNDTVGAVLEEVEIELGLQDLINYSIDTPITPDLEIIINRISKTDIVKTEDIPYETQKKNNSNMYKGEQNVVQAGVTGKKEMTYTVTRKDGVEIDRELINEVVLEEPVTKIVEVGTKALDISGESMGRRLDAATRASVIRSSACYTMTATAYDASFESNGNTTGRGSTGMQLRRGVVAVDPKVIPLNSRLYIESADGSFVYGYAIAGDVGGAIKGNKIDLFFPTKAECYSFGRRTVKVYVIND